MGTRGGGYLKKQALKHWIERDENVRMNIKKKKEKKKSVLGLGSGNKGSGVCEP